MPDLGPAQRLLRPLALGDILTQPEEVGNDSVRIPYRRHRARHPAQLTTLHPVLQLAAPLAAGANDLPNVLLVFLAHVAQPAGMLPHRLLGGVPGRCREGGVHVFDCPFDVSDDDRTRALLDGPSQDVQPRPVLAQHLHLRRQWITGGDTFFCLLFHQDKITKTITGKPITIRGAARFGRESGPQMLLAALFPETAQAVNP